MWSLVAGNISVNKNYHILIIILNKSVLAKVSVVILKEVPGKIQFTRSDRKNNKEKSNERTLLGRTLSFTTTLQESLNTSVRNEITKAFLSFR